MQVRFSAVVEVPDLAPLEDVEDWIKFQLGGLGGLALTNPMADADLCSLGCTSISVDFA
jgi:hypothetical protein